MEEECRNIKDKECKEGFSSQIKEWSRIVKEYTNHADIASLQNVSFRYERGSAYVLRDFHLSIREGEIFCLLGESGCGKTTCLQIFGGFLIPEKGEVLLSGEKYTMLPPEKRPVATVFQSYALFPHLNVVENVSYGLKQKGMKKKEREELAERYLSLVGLSGYEGRNISALSGGQQQRVALARSLAIEPKLLLLDEPLSNLDAGLRHHIREELKALQGKLKTSMLFVTHDQEEAMGLASRVGLMKEGRILQIGTGEELYRNPVNDYVRDFFGECNCISYQGVEYSLRPEEIGMENDTERVEALSGRLGKREEEIVLNGIIQSGQFLAIMKQYLVEWEGRTIKVKISSYAPFQNGESVRLFFHRTEAV